MAPDYMDVKNYPKFGTFVRAVIGLPYVPLERLDEAVKVLNKLVKANTGKRKKFCANMMEYLDRQWMNGNIPRAVWNMFDHRGVTTNNHAEGYNYKMGAKNKISKHPNPYTLADEIRKELVEGCDTYLADIATSRNKKLNPNAQKLIKRRRELMKDLKKRNIDLETFLVSIGAITMKYDSRVRKDNDPDPFGNGVTDATENDELSDDENGELSGHENDVLSDISILSQSPKSPPRQPVCSPPPPPGTPTCQPPAQSRPRNYRKGKKQKQKPVPNTRDSFIHVSQQIDDDRPVPSLIGNELREYRKEQTHNDDSSSPFVSLISAAAIASAGLTALSRFSSSPSARRTPRRQPAPRPVTPRRAAQSSPSVAQEQQRVTTDNDDIYITAASRLKTLGFKFSSSQSRTRGDGNCYLYALLDQIRKSSHPILPSLSSHHHLRHLVCSKLKDQLNANYLFWVETISPDDWLAEMKKDKVWCDEVFIQMAANILNKNFIIIPLNPASAHHGGMYSLIRSVSGGSGDPLYFLYFEEWRTCGHYQSIEPDRECQNNKVLGHYNWLSNTLMSSTSTSATERYPSLPATPTPPAGWSSSPSGQPPLQPSAVFQSTRQRLESANICTFSDSMSPVAAGPPAPSSEVDERAKLKPKPIKKKGECNHEIVFGDHYSKKAWKKFADYVNNQHAKTPTDV